MGMAHRYIKGRFSSFGTARITIRRQIGNGNVSKRTVYSSAENPAPNQFALLAAFVNIRLKTTEPNERSLPNSRDRKPKLDSSAI